MRPGTLFSVLYPSTSSGTYHREGTQSLFVEQMMPGIGFGGRAGQGEGSLNNLVIREKSGQGIHLGQGAGVPEEQ